MVNAIFMFILMMISFAGYGLFLRHKFNFSPAVLPVFIFSCIVVLTFIGGLVNMMLFTVFTIFAAGILLFLYMGIKLWKKGEWFQDLFSPAIIFFVFSSFFLTLLLKDAAFIHYDIFSHWGRIVKEMFQAHSLPDDSTSITFRNYPPGTALFVYYVVTLLGFSESTALIGQAILIAGTLSSLFIFTSWKKPLSFLPVFLLALALLWVDGDNIYTLLVDPFLGYLSIAIVSIAYYYRDQWRHMTITFIPLSSMLILTKDSGKIFYLFCLIWVLGLLISYFKRNKVRFGSKLTSIGLGSLVFIGVPLAINYLWSFYTSRAYEAGYASNRHAVTSSMFDIDYSSDFVQNLLPKLLKASFNLESFIFQAMLLANFLAILAMFLMKVIQKRWSRPLLWSLIFANGMYLVYTASLYGLYLFLMPQNEAVYLAGFSRYQASISIFFIGTLIMMIVRELVKSEPVYRHPISKGHLVLTAVITILPFTSQMNAFLVQEDFEATVRYEALELLKKLNQKENIDGRDRITVLNDIGESDRFYLRNMMEYERLSNTNTFVYTHCSDEDRKARLQKDIQKSDYVVVIQSTSHIEKCLPQEGITDLDKGLYEVIDGVIASKIK